MENEKKRGEKKKKEERNGKRRREGGGREDYLSLVREGVTIDCSMREDSGRAHSGGSTLEYTGLCYPPTCDHTS